MTDINWITLKKLADETGYSEKALREKIARGNFAYGYHYIKAPDGRIHFNKERYNDWVVGDLSSNKN
ncbi:MULTISPECIES: hypothetical protein [unclassified Methylophilus]|uniref:hypothetical protein n=1 Tax=unclassified Methylophilus TaxID=2630143 RepID=UPI00035FD6E4|nr:MULTISPECIES: hypothetical protein [unclassified Methylophilus]